MLHAFRSAYGWTDDVILSECKRLGGEWFLDTYQTIVNEKYEERYWLMLVAPLARTPGSKKGARAMSRYSNKLKRFLEDSRPWIKEEKDWQIRQRLRRPPKSSGMIVVED